MAFRGSKMALSLGTCTKNGPIRATYVGKMRVFAIFKASRASEMAFSLETSSKNGFLAPSSGQLGHLRATWAHLEAILGDLGAILAHLGVILGHIGAILARFGPFQASLGGPENDDFAGDIFQKWHLGVILEGAWTS